MYTSTIDKLPIGTEIKNSFPMHERGYTVRLTSKGIFQRAKEGEVANRGEALENFIETAPNKANAILGINLSITTQSFSNGSFMYIVYSGTPVEIGNINP